MRWLRVVSLGALLLAVSAQQPAHEDITGTSRGTVAPAFATDDVKSSQEETSAKPAPMEDEDTTDRTTTKQDEKTDASTDDNEDNDFEVTPEGSEERVTDETGTVTEEDEGNPSSENGEDNGEMETEDSSTTAKPTTEENKSETVPDSTENGNQETTVPDIETDISRSAEDVSPELAGDVIETEGGPVQGYYLNRDAKLGIRSYYDIPYGIFSYFNAPEKHPEWDTVRKITQHQTRCPQFDNGAMVGELDCLTLSVFAPKNVQNTGVLFHIHDGNFQTGSGDPSIYGPQHLVTKGLIVVLPNYRLNVLGFLCAKDSRAPGNAGLKDLTLALEWTRNNIELFGGDPSKIVVSGDGTAGALAGYLALSPMSRDYVSGVIAESGSVLAHWAIDRNPELSIAKLAKNLKTDIYESVPINAIIQSAKDIVFKPCVEKGPDAFMVKVPWKILHEDNTNITFMMGSASHAGLHEAVQHTKESLSELEMDFTKMLPTDLEFENDDAKKEEIVATVKQLYFSNTSLQNTEKLALCYTDAYYLGPTIRAARPLAAAGAKVFFYEFSFVGDLNREHDALLTTVRGTARGDIVGYVFVQDDDVIQDESDEAVLVDSMTDLWVTFVQTGTPNTINVEWSQLEKVEEKEEAYLSIENELTPRKGMHLDRLSLWTKIYEDHFIDRNCAIHYTSCLFIVLFTMLLKSNLG